MSWTCAHNVICYYDNIRHMCHFRLFAMHGAKHKQSEMKLLQM